MIGPLLMIMKPDSETLRKGAMDQRGRCSAKEAEELRRKAVIAGDSPQLYQTTTVQGSASQATPQGRRNLW